MGRVDDKLIGLGFVAVWGGAAVAFAFWQFLRIHRSDSPPEGSEDLTTRIIRALTPLNWVLLAGIVGLVIFALVMVATNT